jgi:hypothetical protein
VLLVSITNNIAEVQNTTVAGQFTRYFLKSLKAVVLRLEYIKELGFAIEFKYVII